MPSYAYLCPVCATEGEAEIPDAELECPGCGHRMDRLFGAVMVWWKHGSPSLVADEERQR